MPRKLYKCANCGRYTLHQDRCPYCGGPVNLAHPPRWSPDIRLAKYRVAARLENSSKLSDRLEDDKNGSEQPPN